LRVELKPPHHGRFPAIDELKGLAIIIIILSHARSVLPMLAETIRGEVGVDIFLALSGFLLALSSADESIGVFLRKKAWRILPAYWIALIFFVTVKALTLGAAHIESVGLHLFALQLFASPEYIYDINRSFWFVSFIALAYLIFLAVRKHVERTGIMLIVCGALTIASACWYQELGYADGIMNIAPRFLPFFLGIIAGRAYRNGSIEVKPDVPTFCGIALIVGSMLIGVPYTDSVIGAIIISVWLVARKFIGRAKEGLALLGVISYEIFLFHQPLIDEFNIFAQKKMFGGVPSETHLAIGVMTGLLITVALSVGLRHILKKLRLDSLPRKGECALP
jgi:peptidoglycan/LPS O-acetylase OafA/YrhL